MKINNSKINEEKKKKYTLVRENENEKKKIKNKIKQPQRICIMYTRNSWNHFTRFVII